MADPTRTPDRDPEADPDQEPKYEEEAIDATRAEHGREPGVVISVADLVGAKVVTSSGDSRGTVTDVLVSPLPELRVLGLVVGTSGWLHRLRVARLLRRWFAEARRIDEVPWAAVERWDGLRIVLRQGAHEEGVEE